ncbi:signal peptidase I [candidate division KSB1 bacterium]
MTSIVIAVIAALIIRALFLQAFRIPTGSMEKTLLVGDFLLVNKYIYGARIPFTSWHLPKIRDPRQGEVVIFKYPKDPSLDYVKRCIAIGGQTVEIKDKKVYVDGELFDNPPHAQFPYDLIPDGVPEPEIYPFDSYFNRDNYGPFTVPEDHIFVMGDNRDNSQDSRYWGPLPLENMVGKALIIYWSWDYNESFYKILSKVRWGRIGDIVR